jgi:hypothetical protein
MARLRPTGVAQARRFKSARAGVGADCYLHPMPAKSDLKRLAAAVRAAEAEFRAAQGRSSPNAAIRRLMQARAELMAAQAERSMASCVEAMEAVSLVSVWPSSSISKPDCSRCLTTRSASCVLASSGACSLTNRRSRARLLAVAGRAMRRSDCHSKPEPPHSLVRPVMLCNVAI